ncbi:MAG: hypothetical protein LBL04_15470 [Bacteroidales bacterium]|jgi:hypothetical protein|nr:hypothetical protein [Bacteroidales bacterium]
MNCYLYDDVEREKRELAKWYNELIQSLSGKKLESNDIDYYYEGNYVIIDDREFKRRIEGFNAVKKELLKLSPTEKPERKKVEREDDDINVETM